MPERIALALARLGTRVLYCEHPVSVFRRHPSAVASPEPGIEIYRPTFLAERVNRIPLARALQAQALAQQICGKAELLQLRSPILFYPWMGAQRCVLPYLRDKFTFVHVQMDFGEPEIEAHVDISDITLAIPRSVYHQQRGRYGSKIRLIPQVIGDSCFRNGKPVRAEPLPAFDSIPRPRLGYLGAASQRVNRKIVAEILQRRPEWHFVSVDSKKPIPLPNAHILPWQSARDAAQYVANFDLGFMPYDCFVAHNLYCLPLKLFEYFALGLPVVSTPILELWDLADLVYLGDTAEDLEHAVELALQEPLDSPKRQRRIEIAKSHSIANLADALRCALPLEDPGEKPTAH